MRPVVLAGPPNRLNTLPERLSRHSTPVVGPARGVAGLGLAWTCFGLAAYAAMPPIMFHRSIFKEDVPASAMPTLAILAAPASLSTVGQLGLIDVQNRGRRSSCNVSRCS